MKNEYWFKTKKGNTLRLAVPLDEVVQSKDVDIQSFNILNKGEICFFSGIKASDIKISSFFPARKYAFCQYNNFPQPEECKLFFDKIIESKEPVTFIVTGTDINKEFFISKFETKIKQGRDDLFFTLDLKEAPILTINKSIVAKKEKEDSLKRASKHSTNNPTNGKKEQRFHLVKKNETITMIAHKYYGKSNEYKKIYNANKALMKSKTRIKVGWKLLIP